MGESVFLCGFHDDYCRIWKEIVTAFKRSYYLQTIISYPVQYAGKHCLIKGSRDDMHGWTEDLITLDTTSRLSCLCNNHHENHKEKHSTSPTWWLRMRIWRMSLRRTKSTIISWDGSVSRNNNDDDNSYCFELMLLILMEIHSTVLKWASSRENLVKK